MKFLSTNDTIAIQNIWVSMVTDSFLNAFHWVIQTTGQQFKEEGGKKIKNDNNKNSNLCEFCQTKRFIMDGESNWHVATYYYTLFI